MLKILVTMGEQVRGVGLSRMRLILEMSNTIWCLLQQQKHVEHQQSSTRGTIYTSVLVLRMVAVVTNPLKTS